MAAKTHDIWERMEPKPLVPDWLLVLLTPIIYCLFLGVLLLAAPVWLVMRVLGGQSIA